MRAPIGRTSAVRRADGAGRAPAPRIRSYSVPGAAAGQGFFEVRGPLLAVDAKRLLLRRMGDAEASSGRKRPPDNTSRVASLFARSVRFRPGSTCTLVPSLSRADRPAATQAR